MAPIFAIIRYALLETFFCIPILPKTLEDFQYVDKLLEELVERYVFCIISALCCFTI